MKEKDKNLTRREFIKKAGVTGLTSFLAVSTGVGGGLLAQEAKKEEKKEAGEKKPEIPDIPNPGKIGDFLNACTSDAKPICSGEDGVKVMEIMSGALLSAKLKREITVSELYAIEAIRAEPIPGWPIG